MAGRLFLLAWLVSSAAVLAGAVPNDGPTALDIESVRASHAAEEAGTRTPGMCRRLRHLHCGGFAEEPSEFQCRFEELNAAGAWKRKSIIVGRDGDHWVWLDGDSPGCIINEIR